ncbi:MAG TPA: hypothetical protein VF787_16515 [Thermoanaerobaculia bacterium]
MIASSRLLLTLALALFAAGAFAQTEEGFRGRVWSLELPESYNERKSASPASDVLMIGFTQAVRDDGSRPLIQITLVEMPLNMNPATFIKTLREQMIAGVQRRREEWQVKESESTIGDVAVTRYEWSGVTIPAADGASRRAPAHGVMLVGVHEGIGFSLHTQDLDTFAEKTLPEAEQAMRTFRIRRPAAK